MNDSSRVPHVSEPADDLPPLARNVAALRAARGWTLQETSKATGLSLQLISMIERGSRPNPTLDSLVGLAEAFGVTLDALVSAESPTPAPLQELIDAGLVGDLTADELRQLRLARGLLGREPDREDYFALVKLLREKRSAEE